MRDLGTISSDDITWVRTQRQARDIALGEGISIRLSATSRNGIMLSELRDGQQRVWKFCAALSSTNRRFGSNPIRGIALVPAKFLRQPVPITIMAHEDVLEIKTEAD